MVKWKWILVTGTLFIGFILFLAGCASEMSQNGQMVIENAGRESVYSPSEISMLDSVKNDAEKIMVSILGEARGRAMMVSPDHVHVSAEETVMLSNQLMALYEQNFGAEDAAGLFKHKSSVMDTNLSVVLPAAKGDTSVSLICSYTLHCKVNWFTTGFSTWNTAESTVDSSAVGTGILVPSYDIVFTLDDCYFRTWLYDRSGNFGTDQSSRSEHSCKQSISGGNVGWFQPSVRTQHCLWFNIRHNHGTVVGSYHLHYEITWNGNCDWVGGGQTSTPW